MLLVAAMVVLAPVAASAGTSASATSARSDCVKLRAAMGVTAFGKAYATFGACVSRYAPVEQQVTLSANATCTAQQADPNFAASHGGKTFVQFYGAGQSGNNAFAKCVVAVAKANQTVEQQGRLNPARTCRTVRALLTASVFDRTYGKNSTDRNAWGKCVSQTARAQAQNELAASATCKAAQSDLNFAGTHGGKTFDQTYGTNADLSNAFGKCVSSTARATSTAQQHAIVSAALACKAEQKSDPAAFKAKYARFSRCVAIQVANSK